VASPLEKNLVLAPALNRGASIADGDLLLFRELNDMRFDPGFVAAVLVAPSGKRTRRFLLPMGCSSTGMDSIC